MTISDFDIHTDIQGLLQCFSADTYAFMRTLFGNDETIYYVFAAISSNRYPDAYIEIEVNDDDKNRGVHMRGYKFNIDPQRVNTPTFFVKQIKTRYVDGRPDTCDEISFLEFACLNESHQDLVEYMLAIASLLLKEQESH